MIIATNKSGLGNRIKAIVSCMRMSNDHGVHWVKNKDLTCEFGDLFLNKIEVSGVPVGSQTYPSWRLKVLDTDPVQDGFAVVTADKDLSGNRFSYTCPRLRNIDLEYNRIPATVREEYCNIFDRLVIAPTILEEVDKFSQRFNEGTISVHIRSWADDMDRKQDFHRLEKFFAATDEKLKASNNFGIYLTSDSEQVKNMYFDRYGDKVMVYDRATDISTSRYHSAGIVEDFIEMLLLSRNKTIIGTYLSTYTEVAWWFGGAEAEVVIC